MRNDKYFNFVACDTESLLPRKSFYKLCVCFPQKQQRQQKWFHYYLAAAVNFHPFASRLGCLFVEDGSVSETATRTARTLRNCDKIRQFTSTNFSLFPSAHSAPQKGPLKYPCWVVVVQLNKPERKYQ